MKTSPCTMNKTSYSIFLPKSIIIRTKLLKGSSSVIKKPTHLATNESTKVGMRSKTLDRAALGAVWEAASVQMEVNADTVRGAAKRRRPSRSLISPYHAVIRRRVIA